MTRGSHMTESSEPSDNVHPDEASSSTTRRAFLRDVAKKAVYVTPVVMTLTASEARAAASPSCLGGGAPCTIGSECCSNVCDTMMGNICKDQFM